MDFSALVNCLKLYFNRQFVMLYIFNVIIPSKAWNEIVNQTEAEERCKASGGLASFEHFNPPPGTSHPQREPNKTVPEYLNQMINHVQIEEGESVWVSGRANYSAFISYVSCWKSFNRNVTYTYIEQNDLFSCWKVCAGFTYMVMDANRCYCLREYLFNNDFCSNRQYTNGTHVYRIGFLFEQKETFQCTLQNKFNRASTDKCSRKMHGLCENRIDDRQLLNCPGVSTHFDSFCIFNESKSWVEHRDKCVSAGGILLPYSNEHLMFLMEANISYTMGWFRTFTPIPKQARSAALPCLAVTRVKNELWLEPEYCAAKRRYLCNTEHNFDNYSKETSSTYFIEDTITTEATESDAKRRDMCNQTIIIILALISGFAIITVIVLGVCLKRSCRMITFMHANVATKTYEDLQSRNTAGDYSTVQETGMNK